MSRPIVHGAKPPPAVGGLLDDDLGLSDEDVAGLAPAASKGKTTSHASQEMGGVGSEERISTGLSNALLGDLLKDDDDYDMDQLFESVPKSQPHSSSQSKNKKKKEALLSASSALSSPLDSSSTAKSGAHFSTPQQSAPRGLSSSFIPSPVASSVRNGKGAGAAAVTGLVLVDERAVSNSGKDATGPESAGKEKKNLEEGGEGKTEQKKPETPLKTLQVSIISLVAFANILCSVIIFPFLPFFTIMFYPEIPMNRLGVKIGMLASSYFFGDMLGSLVWGRFADTYGRKPAANIGLITSFIGILAFPFSPSYWTSVTIRFLSGFLCGNNSLTRTMMAEACDDTNQHRGFSLIGLATGLARLFAPAIGGLLALPATKYEMFKGTIFETYPYFLPCLVGAVITFLGIVTVTIWLDETLPPRPDAGHAPLLADEKHDEHEMGVAAKKGGFLQPSGQKDQTESLYEVLTSPTVFTIILIYFVHSFVGVISHEIIPMWVVNKKEDHGFAFNTSQIGTILTLVAPFQVAFQGFAYPVLAARWKYIKLFKVCAIYYAVALFLLPYTALLNESPDYILWPAFVGVVALAVCARIGAFTCIFVLLSNSCHKEVRASVNGVGQAASSFGRMLGPTFAGAVFSWSLNNGRPYPLNYHLLFIILTLCCIGSYWGAMYFNPALDFQKAVKTATKEDEDVNSDSESSEDDEGSLLTKKSSSSSGSSSRR